MLFSRQHEVRLYYEGHSEPFVTFTLESQYAYVIDSHSLHADTGIIRFPSNIFVALD